MIFLKCKIRFIYVGFNCKRKKVGEKCLEICVTRSYAALRAADLDWIVGPGYSLGRGHSGKKTMKNQPGTMKNHENHETTLKNHRNQPKTMKNPETT